MVEGAPPGASRVVLVTGSSSGFGELIAETLARAGHMVFATMRDVGGRNAAAAQKLEAFARSEGLRLDVLDMDVASDSSVTAAVKAVKCAAGSIDVVVNNAGVSARGPIEAFDLDQVQELFNINAFGQIRVDKAVLPDMRSRRSGLLIHISSTLGRVLPGHGGLYPATKWALEGLAESLAYQVKAFGVDVVILEPGTFPTPAVGKAVRAADETVIAEYEAAAVGSRRRRSQPGPDYKFPDPQEIAEEVRRLIDLPAGQRPLRSVVGPIFTEGVAEYNETYEKVRLALSEALQRPDQAAPWARG